jgi:hypothetical protein
MAEHRPRSDSTSSSFPSNTTGCLVRVFWMAGGPLLAIASAIVIAERQNGFLGAADAVFVVSLSLMVLLRWIDVRRLDGRTVFGDKATPADWRRHAITIICLGLVAWGTAHAWSTWGP